MTTRQNKALRSRVRNLLFALATILAVGAGNGAAPRRAGTFNRAQIAICDD